MEDWATKRVLLYVAWVHNCRIGRVTWAAGWVGTKKSRRLGQSKRHNTQQTAMVGLRNCFKLVSSPPEPAMQLKYKHSNLVGKKKVSQQAGSTPLRSQCDALEISTSRDGVMRTITSASSRRSYTSGHVSKAALSAATAACTLRSYHVNKGVGGCRLLAPLHARPWRRAVQQRHSVAVCQAAALREALRPRAVRGLDVLLLGVYHPKGGRVWKWYSSDHPSTSRHCCVALALQLARAFLLIRHRNLHLCGGKEGSMVGLAVVARLRTGINSGVEHGCWILPHSGFGLRACRLHRSAVKTLRTACQMRCVALHPAARPADLIIWHEHNHRRRLGVWRRHL